MKKRIKKLLIVLLCIIIQINFVQGAFAETAYAYNPIGTSTTVQKVSYVTPLPPIEGLHHKFVREYGPHTEKGHRVYEVCAICGEKVDKGYYVKLQNCASCYNPPTVTIRNLSYNTTLGSEDTDFKLQIDVSDNDNSTLLCEYIVNEPSPPGSALYSIGQLAFSEALYSINSITEIPDLIIPKPPIYVNENSEIVHDTKSTKTVTFSKGIDATKLKQGINTITVKVRITDDTDSGIILPNSGYAAVVQKLFRVDTEAPVINKCSVSTTYNSANISVFANDISAPIEYRYTVGSNVTGWLPSHSSYSIGNLSPLTKYSYKVEARDIKGNISSPFNSTFTTKTQAPSTSLIAGNNNSIKINISDANPIDILYKIKVGNKYLSSNGTLSENAVWIQLPSKTITATNLAGNTEYKIIVYARDRENGTEAVSQEASIKTTPLAPVGLTCTNKTNNSISLTWNSSQGAYVYDLLRETVVNGSVTETKQIDNIMVTSYTDTGLLTNQTYRYKIRGKSNLTTYGNWSETALDVITTPNRPSKVLGVKAALQSSNINLSWTAQSEAVGYEILINEQQKQYSQTNKINIPFTLPNKQYLLSVRCFNVCDTNNPYDTTKWTNEGEWSEPSIIYTSSNIPKNIVINNVTFDNVQFTWDKNNNPNSVLYKCSLYKGDNLINESNEINTNSYSFSGLDAQTQYTVKVCSINSNGVKSSGIAEKVFSTKIAPPDAPSQLRSSAKDKQITLSWEQSARAKFYIIKRDGVVIADKITDNKFLDTGLTPNTTYTYEIIASNESGVLVAKITQKTKGEAPTIPDGIKFNRFNTYTQVSWNEVNGANGYDIKCDGKIYNTELNTNFEHNGLTPGSVHTYSIRARNIFDNGKWSTPVTIKTISSAPIMPNGIELTATQTKINISWNSVNNADSYVVNIDGNEIRGISIPEYTYSFDPSVASESEHVVKIMAVNEGGDSGYAAPQSIKLLPRVADAPEITGNVEGAAICINWNSIENASSYKIEIDNATCTTTSAITTSYIDSVSSLTQPHTYKVRALFDEREGGWSYPVTVKAIPTAPSQVLGTSGQNIVTIQWSKCDVANIYELSADGVIIYSGPNTTFIHSSLLDNSTHNYSVRAGNQSGYSEWSESITITTKREITSIPQNIKPSKINQGSIVVSWDSVKDAKGYMVKINGGQSQNVDVPMISIATTPQAFYAVRVAAVLDYEQNILGEWSHEISFSGPQAIPEAPILENINATEFAIELNWNNVANAQGYEVEIENNKIVKVYSNAYHDFDIPPKTTRSYRIRSYNESGSSIWSESISASTNEALPGAPINILCKNSLTTTGAAISIDWNDVKDAISYEVKDSSGNSYTTTDSTITIDGLTNGTLYQFQVRALTTVGQGPWGSTVYCVTDISTPKNLIVSNAEDGGIQLKWDTSKGASQYEIEMDGVIVATTEESSINILQAGRYLTHSFRIRALNTFKTSEWTEQLMYNQNIPLQVTIDEGEEFSIMMPVSNVKDINQYKMTIAINTDELVLVDVCEFTPELDTTTTYFKDNNMQIIVENKDNLCYITIFVKNKSVREMTGIINSIKFVGKKKCTSQINYNVSIQQ
ncbi:hypothetical protein JYG23_08930 [Sedimentibacter sp. zth1]|uniref:fibronectin type III domain-containing protein n=1 Tax=Sedimentibacter sp. zth1 TaxID=2816908 RepID=UPI001A925A8D|nr:hypothetical protein [Sedimentibacter sp. zth1]QSX04826.1 hypothetical protein JYG23_08930 [Sedimentibacter sp. zth1]